MVLSNLNRGGIDIIVLTAKKYVILILVIGDKMVGVSVENAVLHLPGESFRTFAFQFTFVGSSPSDFAFLCHSHPFIWLIFYHQWCLNVLWHLVTETVCSTWEHGFDTYKAQFFFFLTKIWANIPPKNSTFTCNKHYFQLYLFNNWVDLSRWSATTLVRVEFRRHGHINSRPFPKRTLTINYVKKY